MSQLSKIDFADPKSDWLIESIVSEIEIKKYQDRINYKKSEEIESALNMILLAHHDSKANEPE